MNSQNFGIGAIVALKTTCHLPSSIERIVHIKGDPNSISPLMIITEYKKEVKDAYNEETGEVLVQKNEINAKVVWYSDKTGTFEETWIYSRYLIVIQSADQIVKPGFEIGKGVIFRTSEIESKKIKVSIYSDQINSRATTNPLLSFVAPPAIVISSKTATSGFTKHNQKNGEVNFETARTTIKIKYYNSVSGKFSEVVLPEVCFKLLGEYSTEVLEKIIKISSDSHSYFQSLPAIKLGNQLTLLYNSGEYSIRYFDILQNTFVEKSVPEKINTISKHILLSLPDFNLSDSQERLSINDVNRQTLTDLMAKYPQNPYAKITYLKKNNEFSTRCIKIKKIVLSDTNSIENQNNDVSSTSYMHAHCYLRDADRFFKITNIQKFELLNITRIGSIDENE